jgi:hypothetical protein
MDLARAEQFCRDYGRAAAGDGQLAAHYGFPHVSFVLGQVVTFADRAQADAGVAGHSERLRACGAGTDIRLTGQRIEEVSAGAALCHLTWAITPADGTPGWQWRNVYGLRQTGEHQYFEFSVSDNEMAEILSRYPAFFGDQSNAS